MGPQQIGNPTGGTALRTSQTHLPPAPQHDFAAQFCLARTDYGVDDDQARRGLFSAVEGAQSRLVIAGMDPDRQAMSNIFFWEYYSRWGRSSGQQLRASR